GRPGWRLRCLLFRTASFRTYWKNTAGHLPARRYGDDHRGYSWRHCWLLRWYAPRENIRLHDACRLADRHRDPALCARVGSPTHLWRPTPMGATSRWFRRLLSQLDPARR